MANYIESAGLHQGEIRAAKYGACARQEDGNVEMKKVSRYNVNATVGERSWPVCTGLSNHVPCQSYGTESQSIEEEAGKWNGKKDNCR